MCPSIEWVKRLVKEVGGGSCSPVDSIEADDDEEEEEVEDKEEKKEPQIREACKDKDFIQLQKHNVGVEIVKTLAINPLTSIDTS
ncbi:hypothetical protein E2C01_007288 [Portunus trituberculatus]|uniref:Uncharacterized protein n=1 Tax=Portunus trituberculatus TaxID=210409 RepID=A0A5B7D042_PORTR|nr:hypothetical protein [Portunus trituberculatus]